MYTECLTKLPQVSGGCRPQYFGVENRLQLLSTWERGIMTKKLTKIDTSVFRIRPRLKVFSLKNL